VGDVGYGDEALKISRIGDYRYGHHVVLLHHLPCFLYGKALVHSAGPSDLYIPDLSGYVGDQLWRLHAEIIQNKSGLVVYIAGSRCNILIAVHLMLQRRVADSRTYRIRIRIPVSYNENSLLFLDTACVFIFNHLFLRSKVCSSDKACSLP